MLGPLELVFVYLMLPVNVLLVHLITIGLHNLCSVKVSLLLIVVLGLQVFAPAGSWTMRIWLYNPDF